MSFTIQEHIIPCQHIRQHDRPSAPKQTSPRLSVKQYSPTNNASPIAGDITIIAAHGNGLVKELYEPLWEDLERLLSRRGRHIRSIWIADTANQGASGLLNEDSKNDDTSWFDHSRDLLHMVNHFRDEILQPIVGVGHSMGAGQLVMLALGHPRLFSTLVLIDPVIAADAIKGMGPGLTSMTLRRQREWSSRQAAEKAFSKAFKSWDPRVLKKFNQFGLYPYHDPKTKDKEISTRLATGRPQELSGVVRPAFIYNGNLEPENMPWVEEALTVDDLVGFIPCSTVYVCGSLSPATNPEIRKDWLARTGTGKHMGKPFGRRRVQAKVIDGVGHFVPMEKPTACAEAVVGWIDEEVGEWEEEEKKLNRWRDMTAEKKEEAMKIWMNNLKAKF